MIIYCSTYKYYTDWPDGNAVIKGLNLDLRKVLAGESMMSYYTVHLPIIIQNISHYFLYKVSHFFVQSHLKNSSGWSLNRQKNTAAPAFINQLCFIVPLYDESFSFIELLSQLLHYHLFAGLLMDARHAAILAAAVVGSGTSCGNNEL